MVLARLFREFDGSAISGTVIGGEHSDYERLRRVWNGLSDRRPAAIVRAGNEADVQRVVHVAAEHGTRLAIRGGGHSLPGLSTCDDGIVLDLSRMNRVAVDPIGRVAEVEGGALLGQLDAAGSASGLVTPAGVVSHTGIAGLTLGGGMGWLSRRFGLTIDNLLSADVVTADGRLVSASPDHEPELFWGLRGGGGNFGVVTKFRFRMHPLGSVLVGRWDYPPEAIATVLRGYRDLVAHAPRELASAFFMTRSNLTLTAFWSSSGEASETTVRAFGMLGRPLSGLVGGQTFLELQSRGDVHYAWGRRYYAKGGFLGGLEDRVIDYLADAIAGAPTPDSELYCIQLGGAIADVEEDATAYSGRNAAFYWIAEPVWDDPRDDVRCLAWGRSTAQGLAAMSQAGNYVNEQADVGKEVAYHAYGAAKYERLARLKARFDPSNLFRLNQNIEPKLDT